MSEENEMDVLMQEASSGRKRQLLLAEAYNTEQFGYASADLTRSSATAGAIGSGLNSIADLGDKLYSLGKDEGYIGQKRK